MSLCECILVLKVSHKFSLSYATLLLPSIISLFFCEKSSYDEPRHVITIILLFCPPLYI